MAISTSALPETTVSSLRSKFFRGLADPSRLAILQSLRPSPLTVGAIVSTTGLTQPNASNHLSCLLDCGLVTRERQGKFMVYALANPHVDTLLALADEVIAEQAVALDSCPRYEETR